MRNADLLIGTVISDNQTPTFEVLRVKLKAGVDVKPGELIRIPLSGRPENSLIARVRSAYESNPNEQTEAVAVRDTLAIHPNYPREEDSTIIYRQVEADLIEELAGDEIFAPQSLPKSGSDVYAADEEIIVRALGLADKKATGLLIGDRVGSVNFDVMLKRESIQRHFFICGTTGSGKSYSMGVLTEELVRHGIPTVFIDTQDEYAPTVEHFGGKVVVPGEDFSIRISSLTDKELVGLIPSATELQANIISAAFLELQDELHSGNRTKFVLDDLLNRINQVGPLLTNKQDSIQLANRRTSFLKRAKIFGEGTSRANWPKLMTPCLAIRCKHLVSTRLQMVATALLRELQDLRLRDYIPPYAVVIDEAHLFVPEGSDSACKQIIREGVRIGRHHGICMFLLTQSPVDIDKRTIRQCNTRLVFALEPDQLDAIRGVKADASDEMLRALPKMPRGTCLLSGTYESVKHSVPVHIRERVTPEGGAAPDIFRKWKAKR
jgi:DNA helicase HerA-like ATPase